MLIRWAADLVGYPDAAGGHIASGGSIATLSAIATARDAHGLAGADCRLRGRVSDRPGPSLQPEGAPDRRARPGPASLRADGRVLPHASRRAGGGHRGRPRARAQALAGHRRRGRHRHRSRGSARSIATVAQRAGCWFHVDAAYGGFFLLTEHGRKLLKGIERSDSVILDPHKGLFLPYGSGIVVVRDARALVATHDYSGAYMQDALREPGELSPADISPELSKHFRGLRMWLPLILLGTRPFTAALDEKLLLARYFRQQIAAAGIRGRAPSRISPSSPTAGFRPVRPWRRPTASTARSWRAPSGTGGCSSPRPCWTAGSPCGRPSWCFGPTCGRSTWRSGCSRNRRPRSPARVAGCLCPGARLQFQLPERPGAPGRRVHVEE